MKIALAATGKDFNSLVDERFGRADYFILTNENADAVEEIIENTAKNDATGAGTGAASLIAEKKAEIVVAGNLGPKAENVLNAAGIEFVSFTGSVSQAIDFIKGNLSMEDIKAQMKTAPDMQQTNRPGMGMGAGRGMGRGKSGCGGGRGQGMGRGGCGGGMGRGQGMGRNNSGRM